MVVEKGTFISDRDKGLIDSVDEHFPVSYHAFCFRHLAGNVKSKFKDQSLVSLFWKAGRTRHVEEFDKFMLEIAAKNAACHQYLLDSGPEHWAEAHFAGMRRCCSFCGVLISCQDCASITSRTTLLRA